MVTTLVMATLLTLLSVALPQVLAEYGWAGGVISPRNDSSGAAVAASPDGELIASSHYDALVIVDTHRRIAVYSATMIDVIYGLQFSANSQYLLVGLESELPSTPALIVLRVSDWEKVHWSEEGGDISAIAITQDDSAYAIPNEDGGFTEWSMEGSALIRTHPDGHSGPIVCISYSSDGSRILSGSVDGAVIVRWRENSTVVDEWTAPPGLSDCTFSVDSSYIVWSSGDSIWVRHHSEGNPYHSLLGLNDDGIGIVDILRLRFSGDGSRLAVLTSGSVRSVVVFDVTAGDDIWPVLDKIETNHVAVDIAIIPDGSIIALATQSILLTLYANVPPEPLGTGGGVDSDQDGVPNSIDTDDDGDGIRDIYDIICVTAKDCHLYPNEQSIRRISIHIDGQVVTVTDSLHLNTTQSTHLRILASTANIKDHIIDVIESALMEEMLCSQHYNIDIMGMWASALTIEGQSFSADSVQCSLNGGLGGRTTADRSSLVEIMWTIKGRIATPVITPYIVSISEGVPTPDNTVAMIIPVFPAHVTIEDRSGSMQVVEIWHRRGGDIHVELLPVLEAEPSPLELALSAAMTYWYALALCVLAVATLSVVLMRGRGKIDFELEEENEAEPIEDESYQEEDYDIEQAGEWSEEYEAEFGGEMFEEQQTKIRRTPTPPAAVRADIARKSQKRGPPRPPPPERTFVAAESETTEPVPTPVKRRVRKRRGEPQVEHSPNRLSDIDESVPTAEEIAIEDALSRFTGKKTGTKRRRVRKSK